MFEINDTNYWLRRQLFFFIKEYLQQSYTEKIEIERIVLEKIRGIVSDDSVCELLANLREAFWPNGTWSSVKTNRSEDEKAKTREEAMITRYLE